MTTTTTYNTAKRDAAFAAYNAAYDAANEAFIDAYVIIYELDSKVRDAAFKAAKDARAVLFAVADAAYDSAE